jgi:hypothetical protein
MAKERTNKNAIFFIIYKIKILAKVFKNIQTTQNLRYVLDINIKQRK